MQTKAGFALLVVFAAVLSSCAPADCRLANNCSPTATATDLRTATPIAHLLIPTVTPTHVVASSGALTDAQLARLGPPSALSVKSRPVILQQFANGVMIIFAKSDKGFEAGSEFVFALAEGGRAWRSADTFVETSKMADNWYTCQRSPGQRPEKSGVPWRGFGKVWCDHSEVRTALGKTSGYEEADINASFQDFERGRAFQLTDWRAIPGWDKDQTYVVYLDSSDPDFASGRWE
jgi:hypothetical protein